MSKDQCRRLVRVVLDPFMEVTGTQPTDAGSTGRLGTVNLHVNPVPGTVIEGHGAGLGQYGTPT